jgi:DNA-directed RNA polymerase subunit K/omega
MSDYDDEEYDDFDDNYFDIDNEEEEEIIDDLEDFQEETIFEEEEEQEDDDIDEEDELYDFNPNKDENYNSVKKTIPILTKYEKTFIIGFRTQQILNGSNILIDINTIEKKTPYDIAVEELRLKRIPFKIKRKLPDNTYELWDIEDFEII